MAYMIFVYLSDSIVVAKLEIVAWVIVSVAADMTFHESVGLGVACSVLFTIVHKTQFKVLKIE